MYFWINTEAFVLDLSDAIVGCQERDRYRLDSLLFVNSSYSAKDLALSRMILALWRFCRSSSTPLSFRLWRRSSNQHPLDVASLPTIMTQRSTSSQWMIFFFSVLPAIKLYTIIGERFDAIRLSLFSRGQSWVFHTPQIYWCTVRCGYQNGALIPIEGVKNTRKGGLNWVFKN